MILITSKNYQFYESVIFGNSELHNDSENDNLIFLDLLNQLCASWTLIFVHNVIAIGIKFQRNKKIWQLFDIASKAIYCDCLDMRRQTLYTIGAVGGKTTHVAYIN